MRNGVQYDDGHECRGCWELQEATFENALEEIVAHEDPRGRFITITDARGTVERYLIDAPMTRSYSKRAASTGDSHGSTRSPTARVLRARAAG